MHDIAKDLLVRAHRKIIHNFLAKDIMGRHTFNIHTAVSPYHKVPVACARVKSDLIRTKRPVYFHNQFSGLFRTDMAAAVIFHDGAGLLTVILKRNKVASVGNIVRSKFYAYTCSLKGGPA